MDKLNFTVDSALIDELGRRLVGKPYIALSELVKNGYDADANQVIIEFMPEKGYIRIFDDGHGMTFSEFKDFWMRIGTPHKSKDKYSRILHRLLTGSKGVGRLSVQLLAEKLTLRTVPMTDDDQEEQWIDAHVNWTEAVNAGELTSASVSYTKPKRNIPFPHGTELTLEGLRHEWGIDDVRLLANEIWWLQPPFGRASENIKSKEGFEVILKSRYGKFKEEFDKQRDAIFPQFDARIEGKCENGKVVLSLKFSDESTQQIHRYSLLDFPHNKIKSDNGKEVSTKFDPAINLNSAEFEIRIYSLVGRLKNFVKVDAAREYFENYGGIQVYDGGFRLPHYGLTENDWLRIESDHAHRLFVSELLPEALQERYIHTERLRFLPTLRRVLGVVKVDTSIEPNLDISITRDRLVESKAYKDLVATLRYALHFYAYEEARRHYERWNRIIVEPIDRKIDRIEDTLKTYRQDIPEQAYNQIYAGIREAVAQVKTEKETAYDKLALLGPLATVGIATLAYQHELRKQFNFAEELTKRIRKLDVTDDKLRSDLTSLADDLDSWLKRARATNTLFDYMAASENVQEKRNYKLRPTIEEILRQLAFFSRGIEIDLSKLDEKAYLPLASLAEWGAIFQNIFTNAFNAMQDSEKRILQVAYRIAGKQKSIVIQDTGHGVDLKKSEKLFEPFERQSKITKERLELGYGGSGLGLTIVRLLGERLGCRTRFIQPEDGFDTAFLLQWEEA